MSRLINDAGLNIITTGEGCVLHAYQDQKGVWTIGFGHTGRDVYPGLVISLDQAKELMRQDLNRFCGAVDNLTHDVSTNDNEFAAMVSLAYNIGEGDGGFKTSSVLRYHRAGNKAQAAKSFELFDNIRIDGVLTFSQGLLNRRKKEAALYLTPVSQASQAAASQADAGVQAVTDLETAASDDAIRADVWSMQTKLKARGYLKGDIDGWAGKLTQDALAAFVKDHPGAFKPPKTS